VWFDYKFICKTPKKGQKPKADTIILFIHARNPQELRGDQQQQYSFVSFGWNPLQENGQMKIENGQ